MILKYITLFVGLFVFFSHSYAQHHHEQVSKSTVSYVCPMHPEVTSSKAGKCPKCGMELVKKNIDQQDSNPHDTVAVNPYLGTNDRYTPFKNFAVPVAHPTTDPSKIPGFTISNLEKDIETKAISGARAGLHLPQGSADVKTIRYDLFVTDSIVNFTGKKRQAIAVNGSLPAPTLVFTVGDTALIYVHNQSDEPTSVHWHGIFLPNRMDGVAHLTQHPIPPHKTYVYKFPVLQDGTFWYHSHFSLQEQIGLYGALIFNKRTEPDIPTIPVVLSDWSDMNPHEINRRLHAGNDWFAIKKKTTQSYSEAIKAGRLGVKLTNEWKRMTAMDVSDVYYEKFLLNGAPTQHLSQFKAGDQVRLRIVNGSASTYFWLSFAGGKLKVIANDANDVRPVEVDRMLIAPSETYDVVVTIPENMKYEFLATAEDRTNHASLWLGSGMDMPADKLPKLDYFAGMKMMNGMMRMNGDMKPMGHEMSLQQVDMNAVMYPELKKSSSNVADHLTNKKVYVCPMHPDVVSDKPGTCPKCGMDLELTKGIEGKQLEHDHNHTGKGDLLTLNYNMLQSVEVTTLPNGPWKDLSFELTGNMNRYVWTLNNKTVSESDKILIKRGENVRIKLYNNSMMRHPMHLHGHDFRLVNQYGERSPLKNVVDIMPMETLTLEFAATEDGDWFFHCHILYHMMSGMGRIFTYENSEPNPEIHDPVKAYKMVQMDDRMFTLSGEASVQSNGTEGLVTYSNTRWQISQMWNVGYKASQGYESETTVGRFIDKMQYLMPYVGFDYHYKKLTGHEKNLFGDPERNMFGQKANKSNRKVPVFGVAYTLPWLVIADMRVDTNGKLRFQLGREDIPLTPRLRMNWMVNTDKEYTVGSRYVWTKYISLGAHYDSDMGLGAGVVFTY